jgi:hypothetical protein
MKHVPNFYVLTTEVIMCKTFCYHHMGNYQLLHHYEPFNVSRYCRILYGISSHEPASHLLPPLLTPLLLPPITPYNICKSETHSSIINMSTACWHINCHYPNYLIGHWPTSFDCKVNRAQAH